MNLKTSRMTILSLSRASDHKRRKIEDADMQGRLLTALLVSAIPTTIVISIVKATVPALDPVASFLLNTSQVITIVLALMLVASILD